MNFENYTITIAGGKATISLIVTEDDGTTVDLTGPNAIVVPDEFGTLTADQLWAVADTLSQLLVGYRLGG